jgi:hypothetical protein
MHVIKPSKYLELHISSTSQVIDAYLHMNVKDDKQILHMPTQTTTVILNGTYQQLLTKVCRPVNCPHICSSMSIIFCRKTFINSPTLLDVSMRTTLIGQLWYVLSAMLFASVEI